MNGEKVIDLLWEVKEGRKHPNKAYKELCVLFNSKQRELLIAFGKKAVKDSFKSDKPRTVEDSYEEFEGNL